MNKNKNWIKTEHQDWESQSSKIYHILELCDKKGNVQVMAKVKWDINEFGYTSWLWEVFVLSNKYGNGFSSDPERSKKMAEEFIDRFYNIITDKLLLESLENFKL